MRVAQLVDSLHIGGAEKLQVTFAQAARNRGVDLTVIRLRQDDDSTIPQALTSLGARVFTFPARSLLDPQRLWQFARFLRRERFDVLQTHLTYSNVVGALAGRMAGTPVVATLHSAALDPLHRPFIHQLEAALLRFAPQRIVAVGYTVAETHQPRVGGRDIRVIPNAVAENPPLSSGERTALRQEIAGDAARPLLICVGRLSPLKGYADLLRAFATVRETHPGAALAIVGGGDLHEELTRQIEALGLSGHAHLLGTRDDVPRLLRASDLYVSASHVEGLPLSILEAMAAGLPIVATSVGDVPHVLVGGSGVTAPAHQPGALAGAIRALLDNPQQRQALGTAAHSRVAQHYTLDAWMNQLLSLYREVATPRANVQPQKEPS